MDLKKETVQAMRASKRPVLRSTSRTYRASNLPTNDSGLTCVRVACVLSRSRKTPPGTTIPGRKNVTASGSRLTQASSQPCRLQTRSARYQPTAKLRRPRRAVSLIGERPRPTRNRLKSRAGRSHGQPGSVPGYGLRRTPPAGSHRHRPTEYRNSKCRSEQGRPENTS